jgi:cbb3-type cytochrome oxidase subunit 3
MVTSEPKSLVQNWPLSSSYVYSEFEFGSELTIVVLLCFLRVWFWIRGRQWSTLNQNQNLRKHKRTTMVNSEPKSKSEETQEDDNGHLWTKIKLWVNIRGRQWSTLNQNQNLRKHKRTTMVNSEPKSNSVFWFRGDNCRPLVFLQFDFGSELTIVVLLCFLRVWFWFRVDHCRPLMFT